MNGLLFFLFSIESPWGRSMIPGISYTPCDKKLGIKIKTSENEWSMENIYMEEKTSIYSREVNFQMGIHSR